MGNVNNSCDGDKGVCSGEGSGIGDGKGGGSSGESCMNSDGGRKDNGDRVSRGELGLGSSEEVVFGKSSGGWGLWKECWDERLKCKMKGLRDSLEEIWSIGREWFMMDGKEDEGRIGEGLEGGGFKDYVEEEGRSKD